MAQDAAMKICRRRVARSKMVREGKDREEDTEDGDRMRMKNSDEIMKSSVKFRH